MLVSIQNWIQALALPEMLVVGLMVLLALYAGRGIKHLSLPNIIGFMLIGALLGPSSLNLLGKDLQGRIGFLTEIALGAVALGIGLELNIKTLWAKGIGVSILIVTQLLVTFAVVSAGIYLLTRDMLLALPIGAIASTTDPAGTMALIQGSRKRRPLSSVLYGILGFDNGLGIVIFGFTIAVATSMLEGGAAGEPSSRVLSLVVLPLVQILVSLAVGSGIGLLSCLLLRGQKDRQGVLIQIIAMLLITIGICRVFELPFIFALLVAGAVIINTQPAGLIERLRRELTEFMPLLYIFFFALAGAKLHITALSQIAVLGLVYVVCRTAGKIIGTRCGAAWGGLDGRLSRYSGMALLSQGGVAIGLALIVKTTYESYGQGDKGAIVLTVVTATCVFFELAGAVLARNRLEKTAAPDGAATPA